MSQKPYITNKELLRGYTESKEKGKITSEFAEMLYKIADRYSYHRWFARYSFREDMVAAGWAQLVECWDKFDPNKVPEGTRPNPFAYYTQCCKFMFLRILDQELKQADIKDSLLTSIGLRGSYRSSFATNPDDETKEFSGSLMNWGLDESYIMPDFTANELGPTEDMNLVEHPDDHPRFLEIVQKWSKLGWSFLEYDEMLILEDAASRRRAGVPIKTKSKNKTHEVM